MNDAYQPLKDKLAKTGDEVSGEFVHFAAEKTPSGEPLPYGESLAVILRVDGEGGQFRYWFTNLGDVKAQHLIAQLRPGDWVTLRRRGDVVDVVIPARG